MRRLTGFAVGLALGLIVLATVAAAQPFPTSVQLAVNQLITGVTAFNPLRLAASAYINWGSTTGSSGYGMRDNAGVIETKNSGGSWLPLPTSATLPTAAPFITKIADSNLSNEFALGTLASAILVNTTTTGVPVAYTGTSCTNQFPRSLSALGAATCASVALATDVSGTLPVANGGTGLTSGTSGGILGYTASGTLASSAALTANALILGGGAGVVPSALGSLGTTTTVLHGNASGAPTFAAVSLTADVSGILPVANGGTNNAFFTVSGPATSAKTYTLPNASTTILTTNAAVTAAQGGTGIASYTTGDLLQASGATTLAALAATSTGNALISGGVGTVSAWGKIGLTTHISGTLAAANGGTGLASYTTGDLLYASGATSFAARAAVATGSVLASAGTSTAPAYDSSPRLTTGVYIGSADPGTPLTGSLYFTGVAFAGLGTPTNGTVVYCTDCGKVTPCAGAGTGALAKRINSTWDCD